MLLNNGNKTFQTHQDFATGDSPYDVIATDLNGSGNLDLVTANELGGDVSVLLGNGDGTFGTHTEYGTDAEPYWVIAARPDGRYDLITANNVGDDVSVLINNSTDQVPTAVAQTASVQENSSSDVLNLLTGDTDPDGDSLLVWSVTTPSHGTATVNNGTVTYTPTTGYAGSDSFSYTIVDGFGGSSTSTVAVTVTAVPITPAQSVSAEEDTTTTFQLNASETGIPYANLTFNVPTTTAHGTLTYAGTPGNYIYTPTWSYTGSTDSFTYTATDPSDVTSTAGTVTLNITSDNSYTTPVNLGTVSGTPVSDSSAGLSSSSDVDWYEFTLAAAGNSTSNVAIAFTGASGLVVASLYTSPSTSGPVATSTNATNSATISLSGMAASTYYVRVYGSTCAYGLTVTPTPPPAPPTAPTGVAASKNTYYDHIQVSWTAVSTATGYDVYRNTANNSSTATKLNSSTLTTTSYSDTTMTAGATYYYWVVAKNATGSSPFSSSDYGVCAAVVAPTGVTASDGTYYDHVAVNWTASTGATGYDVYRSTTDDPGTATQINSSAVTTASYSDTTITAGTTYYYWVTAMDALSTSGDSASATGLCAAVAAPTGVTASAGTYYDHVAVSWTASTGATGYNVYRNTSNTTTGATQINASAVTTTSYSDTTMTPGTTYYYWVVATDALSTSEFSNSASGLCAAVVAPTGVTASAGTYYDHVAVSWTASTGATGYNVYRNTINTTTGATQINASDVTTTSYSDTTITPGTTYYYWVVATDALSTSGYSTGTSGLCAVMSAPTGVSASDNTYTDRVEVTWAATTGATAYDVYRSLTNDSSTSAKVNSSNVTTTTYDDMTITAGTTYYYWVVAKNSLTSTGYSAGASGVCATVSTPTGLSASKSTYDDHIALSWTASTGATSYDVYRNTTSTTTGATQLNASPITTTTYSDTAVTATTTYYYWVIAVNTAGASTYSTSDYGVCALVSAPTGVSATKNTYLDKVQITWAASTGATAYDVYRNTTNTSGTANKLNSSDITTTSYNDTTAVAGTTYYFWVVARNAEGTSAFSNSDTGERSAAIQEVKPNNTYTLAQNVGTVTGVTLIDGNLASSSDVGWYEFTLPVAGNSSSSVVVGFTGASGQVQAAIYSNPAKSGPVATSTNAANSATMSLNGFAAGAYYIRVYGSAAYTYTITITPPAPRPPRRV